MEDPKNGNSSSNFQLAEIDRKLDILLKDRQKLENLELRIQQLESTESSKSQEYVIRLQAKNEEIQRLRRENSSFRSQLGIPEVAEDTGSQDKSKTRLAKYKLKKRNKKKLNDLEQKDAPTPQDPNQMMMNMFSQFPGFVNAQTEEAEIPGLRELNLRLKNDEEEDDATYFARLRQILEDESVQGTGTS